MAILPVLTFGRADAANLVPNADFESFSVCPAGCSQVGGFVDDWTAPTDGTSDYLNACQGPPNFCGVPANVLGSEAALSGQAYGGFFAWEATSPDYREYLEVQLTSPLVANTTYQVSFHVSLCDDCDTAVAELAAYLQPGPVGYQAIMTPLAATPQVVNLSGPVTNKSGWQLVSGTFVAAGGENHLVIGNFNNASTTTTLNVGGGPPGVSRSYYFVDDVSVTELVGTTCMPSPDGRFCEGGCGTPDETCAPREILTDANGHFLAITCCDCTPSACHIDYEPATQQLFCVNACGAPDQCTMVAKGNSDGTITYSCRCIDPSGQQTCEPRTTCDPACDTGVCEPHCAGPCPTQGDACVMETLTTLPGAPSDLTCTCISPEADVCRLVDGPAGPECIGTCPAGTGPCELITTMNPDQTVSYSCSCDPVPAPCEPDAAALSCTGQCPDGNEQCFPKEIVADANGNFVGVSCCECGPAQCRLDYEPATGAVQCVDPCGDPNTECRLVGKGNLDGTITYTCDCLDPTAPSECDFISECNPCVSGTCRSYCSGPCPDPFNACVPEHIIDAGQSNWGADCICDDVGDQSCRPVLDPVTQTVVCQGSCPQQQPCPPPQQTVDPDTGAISYHCPPCGGEPIGACCFSQHDPAGGAGSTFCVEVTQVQCDQIPGVYFGDGTSCDDIECPQPTGACCLLDSCDGYSCAELDLEDCIAQGGSYLGHNSTCNPDPCQPEVGACCVPNQDGTSTCMLVTPAQCNDLFGYYHGDGTTCSPDPCTDPSPSCGVAECCQQPPKFVDPLYAGFTGPVAVATGTDFWSAGQERLWVYDIKDKASAPLNTQWTGATGYTDPSWNATNLGNVFGITLDRIGNIYVTASSSYWSDTYASGGPGAVYKINTFTGAISTFAVLPNTGPGLGNIAYNCTNRQFFVTNFEDGLIYRLSASGAVLSTFDHGAADNGAAGFAPLGERLWAVEVHDNRVYYGVWQEDAGFGRSSAATANTIWSVALVGGNFSGAPQLEVTLPDLTGQTYSSPPSDLSFSTDGCMLIGTRSMYDDTSPSAHVSEVLEYRYNGSSWVPSGHIFDIGFLFGGIVTNSAGGVDYEIDGTAWMTGDALQYGPQYVYGLQNTPGLGGGAFNSVLLDLNGNTLSSDKMQIGDVEVPCLGCVKPPVKVTAWWPLDETSGTNANEVVNNIDGTHANSPQPIPGRVANALRFDGVNDVVITPDNNLIDFDNTCPFFAANCVLEDLSIDAWVRICEDTGVHTIVNKLAQQSFWFWSFKRGYDLSLMNGVLALTLADEALFFGGSTTTFVDSSATGVADGQWHHVAVSVDRDQPAGGVFYVDGVSVSTFNPTVRNRGLANNAGLRIGARTLPTPAQFAGDIDEVQIFRRAITAADVQSIYGSWNAGKCKDKCHSPAGLTYCINQSTKTANLTICNDSVAAQNYAWYLGPMPVSPPECTVAGPTTFSPSSGTVSLAAGQCTTVAVVITAPVGLTVGQTACYAMNVYNTGTGHTVSCPGKLYRGNIWCPIKDVVLGDIIVINSGKSFDISFQLTNEADADETVGYTLQVTDVLADPASPPSPSSLVSLDGLPPGEPVIGTAAIPVGQSTTVTVEGIVLSSAGRTMLDASLSLESPAGKRGGEIGAVESIGVRTMETDIVVQAPATPPAPHDVQKNRYLAFVPNNGTSAVAYSVTLSGPDGGLLGWVGAPDADGLSRVLPAPAVRVWSEPVVFIGDCEIAPDHGYEIAATADGTIFSDPLFLQTVPQPSGGRFWGDMVGGFMGGAWTAPDGNVNGFDIVAVLKTFQIDPTAPHYTWVDLNPQSPDKLINGQDILQAVNAFSQQPYPFAAPGDCP